MTQPSYQNAELRILTDWEQMRAIEPAWRKLHQDAGAHGFSSYDWLEIQEDVFVRSAALHVATLWHDGALIAALPLIRNGKRLSKLIKFFKPDALELMECQYTGYMDVMAEDDAAASALMERIARHSKKNLILDMVVDRGATRAFLNALPDAGYTVRQSPNFKSILINGAQSYQTYISQRSHSFRKANRRAMRRLDEAKVSFEVVPSADPTTIERVLNVSRRSWKQAAGSGVAAHPQNAAFVARVLAHDGPDLSSTTGFLTGPDGDIAFVIMLHFRRTAYGIWVEFDEAREDLSPGRSIVAKVLEHLFEAQTATTIDFMRKTHFTGPFADEDYAIDQVHAFPKHSASHLVFACDALARRGMQKIMKGRRKTTRRSDVKKAASTGALPK